MTELARNMLSGLGGPGTYGLRNLGIDFTGGKHRAHPRAHTTRAQRWRKLAIKKKKLATMKFTRK
eukprot:3177424-Pyramimonas_sp.AAC.1